MRYVPILRRSAQAATSSGLGSLGAILHRGPCGGTANLALQGRFLKATQDYLEHGLAIMRWLALAQAPLTTGLTSRSLADQLDSARARRGPTRPSDPRVTRGPGVSQSHEQRARSQNSGIAPGVSTAVASPNLKWPAKSSSLIRAPSDQRFVSPVDGPDVPGNTTASPTRRDTGSAKLNRPRRPVAAAS